MLKNRVKIVLKYEEIVENRREWDKNLLKKIR